MTIPLATHLEWIPEKDLPSRDVIKSLQASAKSLNDSREGTKQLGRRKSPGSTLFLIPVLRDTVTPITVSVGRPRGQGCCGITWGPFRPDALSVWHELEAQLLDLNPP